MSDRYLIFMDASGDVDSRDVDPSQLTYIPMEVSIGDELHVSTGPESPIFMKGFYDAQRKNIDTKTSLISPYAYEQFLVPYFEQGFSVLYLCLSGGLSSTFGSACSVRRILKERYPDQDFLPVDTRAATAGIGLLAARAVRNRSAGMSLMDNYHSIRAMVPRIRHWFLVQDLNYLRRGGRISSATAVVGGMLNIKPILTILPEGTLATIDKKRGSKAAAACLLQHFREDYDPASGDAVYIVHSDDEPLADLLEKEVRQSAPDAPIMRTLLCPVIGAHTGPGLGAVVYVAGEGASGNEF